MCSVLAFVFFFAQRTCASGSDFGDMRSLTNPTKRTHLKNTCSAKKRRQEQDELSILTTFARHGTNVGNVG